MRPRPGLRWRAIPLCSLPMVAKAGSLARFVLSPLRACGDVVGVAWTVARFLRPVDRRAAATFADIEGRRQTLNRITELALRRTVDYSQPVGGPVYDELDSLYKRQVASQDEVDRHLHANAIRREPALRAGAAAVMYQLALKLRKAELETFDLAFRLIDEEATTDEHERLRTFADSDLRLARQCYVEVRQRYLRALEQPDMRRDRLARRAIWAATFRWREAVDRDSGINDIRQELAGYNSFIREIDGVLQGTGGEYFSARLAESASDAASVGDVELVGQLHQIVLRVSDGGYDALDHNYPVLIDRSWAIRAKLNELPAWWWSMRWRAHCAILHGWLLLFAAAAAERDGRRRFPKALRAQALNVQNEAARLIAEIALLERPLKPLVTAFSMHGRQVKMGAFGAPPSRQELLAASDALSVRVNRDLSPSC